jgi:hypothetical protein
MLNDTRLSENNANLRIAVADPLLPCDDTGTHATCPDEQDDGAVGRPWRRHERRRVSSCVAELNKSAYAVASIRSTCVGVPVTATAVLFASLATDHPVQCPAVDVRPVRGVPCLRAGEDRNHRMG